MRVWILAAMALALAGCGGLAAGFRNAETDTGVPQGSVPPDLLAPDGTLTNGVYPNQPGD